MKSLVAMLHILLLTTLCQAQTGPAITQGVGIDQHLGTSLPLDTTFTDETGTPEHLGAFLHPGRPAILVLVYYQCPMLCTLVLNDTITAARVIPLKLGQDYDIIAVSFNPSEKPDLAAAKRKSYLAMYGHSSAAQGLHFLTGDAQNIQKLTNAVGFHYRWDEDTKQYVHPAGVTILTPEGRISRYFFGVEYDPADIRLSLIEASRKQIGSLTDHILLLCYHYDPMTGRYGWAVKNLLRGAGIVTIAGLAVLMGFLIRYDRRRTRRLMYITSEKSMHAGGSS